MYYLSIFDHHIELQAVVFQSFKPDFASFVKGSTAQVIIKTLKGKRLEGMLAHMAAASKGDLLVKMCKYLHVTDAVTEADMRARFSLSTGQYFHCIDVIGSMLTSFLGTHNDEAQPEHTFQLASDLVKSLEVDAAVDVIRSGIKSAAQIELFDLVVRYWELVETIHLPPKIDGMDERTARKLRANLHSYADLLSDLRLLAKEPAAIHRRSSIAELLSSDLLHDPSTALSNRAAYFFWKIRVNCLTHLREYGQAISCQETLLHAIQCHPYLVLDTEYAIVKETSLLAVLLRLNNQAIRFSEVSASLEGMKLKGIKAHQARDFFHYPASIGAALQFGDSTEATLAIQNFLELLATRGPMYAPTYLTENLYWCLYASLALQQKDYWIRVSYLLGQYGKPDFNRKLYPMYRFLEVIHSMELQEWEDALRLIKNLRVSNGLEELEGMREVLSFLSNTISKWSQLKSHDVFELGAHSFAELLQITNGIDLVDYFDLPSWFLAIQKGCPMMEVLHHRTNLP